MTSHEPASRPPAEPDALGAIAALCGGLEEVATAQEVLQRALPIVRTVLGDRVALDLRPAGQHRAPPGTAGVVAPLQAGGRHFGDLRATGIDPGVTVADAFASAAGHVIGTALLLQQERAERVAAVASTTSVVAHRLRSSLATIGVAASTLRMRGNELEPDLRLQLLHDIEANVVTLRGAVDALGSRPDAPGAHDG